MSFWTEVLIVFCICLGLQIAAYCFINRKGYYYLKKIVNLDGKDFSNSIMQIKKDGIHFLSKSGNLLKFVNYRNITDISIAQESLLTEKDKSVLGRAFVGGLIFGVTGAIVGGMSGIGTSKKEEKVSVIKFGTETEPIFAILSSENLTIPNEILKKSKNAWALKRKEN